MFWQGWQAAACLSSHCFCEGPYWGNSILQPMNTLTALGFLVSAVAMVLTDRRSFNNEVVWNSFFKTIYFGALILLWFGTALFHASLTNIGQWGDGMGLYTVITFVGLYFLNLSWKLSKLKFTLVFVLLNLVAGFFSYQFMQFRLPLFGTFVGLTFFIILFRGKDNKYFIYERKYLALAISLFVVGLGFQVADNKLLLCSQFSIWQGHALWHILSAVATYYLYLLMKTAKSLG